MKERMPSQKRNFDPHSADGLVLSIPHMSTLGSGKEKGFQTTIMIKSEASAFCRNLRSTASSFEGPVSWHVPVTKKEDCAVHAKPISR